MTALTGEAAAAAHAAAAELGAAVRRLDVPASPASPAAAVAAVVGVVGVAGEEVRGEAAEAAVAAEAAAQAAAVRAQAQAQALRERVDQTLMPAHAKTALRNELAARDRALGRLLRDVAAARIGRHAAVAERQVAAAVAAGEAFSVLQLPDGVDGGGAQGVLRALQKAHASHAMLVLAADAHGKVACVASTPATGALQANLWLAAALAPCGGRGGGKPSFAQGSAPDAGALPAAIEAARAFAAGPQT